MIILLILESDKNTNTMENSKKVMIFTLPASGHTNPVLALCKELLLENKFKVIVYSGSHYRKFFESVGAEFRQYDGIKCNIFERNKGDKDPYYNPVKYIYDGVNSAYGMVGNLYQEVLKEKPDLVIYDNSAYFAKITIRYIFKEFKKKAIKAPKIIGYSTSFYFTDGYLNSAELALFEGSQFLNIFYLILLLIMRLMLILKYGFDFSFFSDSPYGPIDNSLILVFLFPELQARTHLLDANAKFIGCSIDQNLHYEGENDREKNLMNNILNEFNENSVYRQEKRTHLIYASLGTIFNRDISVYARLIEGFQKLLDANKNLNFTIVLSTGEYVYDLVKELNIPKEIVIVKSAPQIQLLKRASLFVTHNGMNRFIILFYHFRLS